MQPLFNRCGLVLLSLGTALLPQALDAATPPARYSADVSASAYAADASPADRSGDNGAKVPIAPGVYRYRQSRDVPEQVSSGPAPAATRATADGPTRSEPWGEAVSTDQGSGGVGPWRGGEQPSPTAPPTSGRSGSTYGGSAQDEAAHGQSVYGNPADGRAVQADASQGRSHRADSGYGDSVYQRRGSRDNGRSAAALPNPVRPASYEASGTDVGNLASLLDSRGGRGRGDSTAHAGQSGAEFPGGPFSTGGGQPAEHDSAIDARLGPTNDLAASGGPTLEAPGELAALSGGGARGAGAKEIAGAPALRSERTGDVEQPSERSQEPVVRLALGEHGASASSAGSAADHSVTRGVARESADGRDSSPHPAAPELKAEESAQGMELSPPGASTEIPLSPPGGGSPTGESKTRPSSMPSVVTSVASLGIVLGLFLVFAWFLRRLAPGATTPLPKEVVEVLGQTTLGGKQQVYMLRCGRKLILVSVTAAGIETLTEVTDPIEVDRLAGMCLKAQPNSPSNSFRQVFQQAADDTIPPIPPTSASDSPYAFGAPLTGYRRSHALQEGPDA
jgi:flagellar biogenesis protein FliO